MPDDRSCVTDTVKQKKAGKLKAKQRNRDGAEVLELCFHPFSDLKTSFD